MQAAERGGHEPRSGKQPALIKCFRFLRYFRPVDLRAIARGTRNELRRRDTRLAPLPGELPPRPRAQPFGPSRHSRIESCVRLQTDQLLTLHISCPRRGRNGGGTACAPGQLRRTGAGVARRRTDGRRRVRDLPGHAVDAPVDMGARGAGQCVGSPGRGRDGPEPRGIDTRANPQVAREVLGADLWPPTDPDGSAQRRPGRPAGARADLVRRLEEL